MSNEEAKNQHSKRIQQKYNYIKKQVRIAKSQGIEVKLGEEHRLQDHAVVNCGIPGCILCANPRRVWRKKTIKEKSFEQTSKWISDGE